MQNYDTNVTLCSAHRYCFLRLLFIATITERAAIEFCQSQTSLARALSLASERRPSTVKFKAATFGKYRRPRTRSKARGTNEKVSSPFDVFRRVSTTTRPAQKLALPCAAPLVNDRQGGMVRADGREDREGKLRSRGWPGGWLPYTYIDRRTSIICSINSRPCRTLGLHVRPSIR